MAAARSERLPPWLTRDRPDYLNLRKAARATLVVPAVLAFGMFAIGNASLATYSVFAAFVGLVFADYGGPARRRAGAYLTMMLGGSAVIVLGGLLTAPPVAGVLGMFAVALVAGLASAFGGYRALHVAPLILAYALSVLQPLSQLAVADRAIGWVVGSAAALGAALVLWPVDRRLGLREATGALLDDLAELVGGLPRTDADDQLRRVRSSVDAAQSRLSSPLRPFGPATRDIALVRLNENLRHCVDLAEELIDTGGAADSELLADVTRAFVRSREVLLGECGAQEALHDLVALDAARQEALAAVGEALVDPPDPGPGAAEAAVARFPLLAMSHLAVWIEHQAVRVVGATPIPDLGSAPELSTYRGDGVALRVRRTRRMVSGDLDPAGFILRNALRAAVALSAAVAAADLLPVEHGFWIVLATLSVLRSGASSTYANAQQAVGGTAAGFALAVLVVWGVGDSTPALWALFVVCVALAAYTPGAVHFAVGQAAFALLVVALFGLLDLPGVPTAVVRVETVAIGAVTAVVLSLVLWPRGATTALGRALAGEYAGAARGAEAFVTGSTPERAAATDALDAARRQSEATFAAALNEHNEPIDIAAWVSILQPPTLARALLAGLIPTVTAPAPECLSTVESERESATVVSRDLAAIAHSLDGAAAPGAAAPGAAAPGAAAPPGATRPPVRAWAGPCIDSATQGPAQARNVVWLLAWGSYIDRLARQLDRARPALRSVAAASTTRAWLRSSPHASPRAAESVRHQH